MFGFEHTPSVRQSRGVYQDLARATTFVVRGSDPGFPSQSRAVRVTQGPTWG